MKYVKDGGWVGPVVRRRRKKSARSEESESSRNLNVNDKRSLVRYRKMGPQEFISLRKFKSFEMGGSESQPYCLEN